MLESVFSFQGRIGRMPFFLGGLGMALAYLVGLVAAIVGSAAAARRHEELLLVGLFLTLLPLLGATVWCSMSLHVRRIRDIGWNPAIVISTWLFAKIVDKHVLALLPALATHGLWTGTLVGVAIDLTLSLTLLFWPGHGGDDLQPGPPRRAASGRLAPAPSPIPAARLASVAGERREFGRR